jgi:hypothetical protein
MKEFYAAVKEETSITNSAIVRAITKDPNVCGKIIDTNFTAGGYTYTKIETPKSLLS